MKKIIYLLVFGSLELRLCDFAGQSLHWFLIFAEARAKALFFRIAKLEGLVILRGEFCIAFLILQSKVYIAF